MDALVMRLVASMIWQPGEIRRYQPALLHHSLTYCDEATILYDGPVDDESRALETIGRVTVMHTGPSLWEREGEGVARQRLLEFTLALDADWVLSIDADEVVPDGAALRAYLEGAPADTEVCSLRMVEVWSRQVGPTIACCFDENAEIPPPRPRRWAIRVDGGWAPRHCPIVWRPPPATMTAAEAFRLGWSIANRRLACGREPERVRYLDAVPLPIDMAHLGWSNPAERGPRYQRYVEIDGGEYHASAHIRSIMEPPTLELYAPAPGVQLL